MKDETIETTQIPDKIFKSVCRPGEGAATCRYIVAGSNGIECAKHLPDLRNMIDKRVATGTFTARGDNCDGIQPKRTVSKPIPTTTPIC